MSSKNASGAEQRTLFERLWAYSFAVVAVLFLGLLVVTALLGVLNLLGFQI